MSPDLPTTFTALADPTRLEIVERLARGPCTISDLAAPFDTTLRNVLKHVGVLETAGLVRTTKSGRIRQCELNPAWLDGTEQWLTRVRSLWTGRLARMDRYLKEQR
jgi:DNA-binding transcriptional ArsR family regulator